MNDPRTFLEPLGGYLLDALAKLRNRPFVPHSLTKLHNLKVCRDFTGATTAIEVGSFKGVMTRRLSYLFDKVVSIEIDPTLYEVARQRNLRRRNVELILGDGAVELPKVAARVSNAVLFLDGHFSGGSTGMGDDPEPVLVELDRIGASLVNIVALVVDDFRLFGLEPGWPTKSEIMNKLESLLPAPAWAIYIQNDQFMAMRSAA